MLLMITVILGLLALLMLYMVLRQWRKGRWLGMLRYTFLLVVFAALTAAAVVFTFSFALFHNLTYRDPIATVSIERQAAPDHYQLTVTLPNGSSKNYALLGDSWLFGAHIVVWEPWMQALGIHNTYQLDFLSSRFNDPDRNDTTLLPDYRLNDMKQHAIVSWVYQHTLLPYLIAETVQGSAVYMPLKDKTQYQIFLTPSGLLAKPA